MSDILEFVKSTKVYLDNLTNYKEVAEIVGGKYSDRDMLYTAISVLAEELSEKCEDETDVIHRIYFQVKKYLGKIEEVISSTHAFDTSALAQLSAYTIGVLGADYFLTTDYDVQASLLHSTRTLESISYLLNKMQSYIQASQWTAQQYMRAVVSTYVPFLRATNFIDDLGNSLRVHLPQEVQEV